MRRTLTIISLLAALSAASAGDLYTKDGKYDFFGLSRYPEGGKRVEGVELYKVTEEGGAPEQYARRVVRWWPRKGVDFIEVKDGMILREWTRKADALEGAAGKLGEPELVEHERIAVNDNAPDSFLRRFRGYLQPPEDGNYEFKISAHSMGVVFVSADENPANKQRVCAVFSYARGGQWDRFPGQISAPVPMKKGRKYYFEVISRKAGGSDHLEAAWEGDAMTERMIGGEDVLAMDGERGKVLEEKWKTEQNPGMRPHDLPRRFKAHLIGFDGIGNPVGDPYMGEDFVAPTVILRMPDGTKRAIEGDTFCQADREFIMQVYSREMARVQAGLDKTPHIVHPGLRAAFPGGVEPGEPGTMLTESEHFAVPSGSQSGGKGAKWRRWINEDEPEKAARLRECLMGMFEHFHAYLEYGGHLMPYWDREKQYKYSVKLGGTVADGFRGIHAGRGGGYGGLGMNFIGSVPGGFGHEYGHGFSVQWNGAHSGEILANAVTEIGAGGVDHCDNSVARPYRNCLHASYDTVLFYRMIGFDPNWGMCALTALPRAADEVSFFQTLARLGEQRGLFADGIRGVGDMVGDYGARLAEFDTQNREGLRREYFAAIRNYLTPVDAQRGIYRIPWYEAPEAYGVNIVRLLPDRNAKAIEVDFQGYHDPAVYSDWRACIVAVDKDGKARYSELWNKGGMMLDRRDGDMRYWLTVAATPGAMFSAGRWTAAFLTGRHAPRFPWQVTLRGAQPGRPHLTRADLHDIKCAYGQPLSPERILPALPDTEYGARFVKDASDLLADLKKRQDAAEGQFERINAMQTISHVKQALSAAAGAPHPNGGGWVAATAQAAPTAYVGPHAAVLDGAKVLDRAVVEDCAVIRDRAVVSGYARVSGRAVVARETRLGGYARVWNALGQAADEEAPELSAPTDEYGLLANYAMDQAEAVMLENYYGIEGDPREFFEPLLNGYLHGNPRFIAEPSHRGFAFDGETQYAELNQWVADLPRITVDLGVKWQGSGRQVLLDFGSDAHNRFILATAGEGGKPEFTALVDGKTAARLAASRALPKDEWTKVRLEIDGEKIALWIDDEAAGEAESALRPCDVFKPGLAKRNFLAAARELDGKFKGVIGSVVIYNEVHGVSFAKLPDPVIDSPRRPQKDFVEWISAGREISPYEKSERSARISGPMGAYLGVMSSKATVRLSELMNRSPDWPKAIEKAKEIDQWIKEHQKKFQAEFDASAQAKEIEAQIAAVDEQIAPLKKEFDEVKKRKADAPAQTVTPTPEMRELREQIEKYDKQIAALQERIKELEQAARATVDAMPETAAEQKEIKLLEEQIKPLEAEARAKLKAALAEDDKKDLWDRARRELEYSPLYWRVRASQGVGGREAVFEEQLKSEDPEYRQWVEMKDTLEDLKKRSRYRYENHLMKRTERDNLQLQVKSLGDESRSAARELAAMEQDARGEERDALEIAAEDKLSALNETKKSLSESLGELRNVFIAEKMRGAGLPEKEKERQAALSGARNEAMARYWQEDSAIQGMQRSAFHGFYNGPYKHGIGQYCARVVGDPSVRVDVAQSWTIAEAYSAPGNWKTRVDQWDWRTGWEKNGSMENLPLTKKWLRRVGGIIAKGGVR